VVSERSAEEIKKQEATQALKAALVNLTGNLIRVVRGAGKPDRIIEQLHAVAVSYTEYSDAHGGEADSSVYREMLRFETPELPERDDRARAVLAEHAICRTALQVVNCVGCSTYQLSYWTFSPFWLPSSLPSLPPFFRFSIPSWYS
jgi:hypothetical protein